MAEHVLPRPAPDDVDNAGDSLAHIFCHTCNGVSWGDQVTVPVTSLCASFHGVPRRGVACRLPMCVVCADITDTGHCPHGHSIRRMKEMLRDRTD